jgi:hypothetical protein
MFIWLEYPQFFRRHWRLIHELAQQLPASLNTSGTTNVSRGAQDSTLTHEMSDQEVTSSNGNASPAAYTLEPPRPVESALDAAMPMNTAAGTNKSPAVISPRRAYAASTTVAPTRAR